MQELDPTGSCQDVPACTFASTDETAVFLEEKQNRVVYFKRKGKISTTSTRSNSRVMTVCVAFTSDDSKVLQMF